MDNLDISVEDLKKYFDSERISFLIEKFSQIGRDEYGGVTRLAFSKEDLKAREEFIKMLGSDLHVNIRTDTLGNIFARREGRQPDLPVIMTGSHLDSVRNGGKFDGPAGVFSSFEAFRAMDYLGIETEHPYEIVVFTSEEPNTFGISTLGSRGVAGRLRKADLEGLRDDQGNDLPGALSFIGGDFNRIEDAVLKPGAVEYFVELHIEQMPYLEREKKDIGIVSGVTGIYRERIDVKGMASHCGTTPMDERSDALCAASEIILALEAAARKENGKAVATVGHITVFPNSTNITPGLVEMDVEIRSYYPDSIQRIITVVNSALSVLQNERKVQIDQKVLYET
ncbi:MAG: Zn-dependent hydrolase, partial [Gammaproteobacteria bacterium]|nr:Zn-dependent hydrolase [Gammaproteobacteria bacterium]